MPSVSSSELARLRSDVGVTFEGAGTELASIWRPPAMVGTKRSGNPTQVATNVPLKIWPSIGQGTQQILETMTLVPGARADAVGFAPIATDLKPGDEVRTTTRTFKVAGLGRWNATIALALSEVSPR